MDYRIEKSDDVDILTIQGALTIEHAAEFRAALMELMESAEHPALNLEGVTDADLTCLQLLCSAHRTVTSSNERLTLDGAFPLGIRRASKAAGFSRHTGCSAGPEENCLWIEKRDNAEQQA
jgi:ABC-type transporter Mla MlaB component